MERFMQKPFTDPNRSVCIYQALVRAYEAHDREAIAKAAQEAQKYVDEGGDFMEHFSEEVWDYQGDNPETLTKKYLLRLLRDRHCDDDEDKDFIRTGMTDKADIFHTIRCCNRKFTSKEWNDYCAETYKESGKRIVTSIGKYDFNDCDICLNPTVISLVAHGGAYGYCVTLKWCDCGNGRWSYGLDYSCGTGGGGFGCSWADGSGDTNSIYKGYPSEKEAIIAACDAAIKWIGDPKDDAKKKRLLEMVKEHKKSIGRPAPVQLSLFDF